MTTAKVEYPLPITTPDERMQAFILALTDGAYYDGSDAADNAVVEAWLHDFELKLSILELMSHGLAVARVENGKLHFGKSEKRKP
jgi:hypothetical protein